MAVVLVLLHVLVLVEAASLAAAAGGTQCRNSRKDCKVLARKGWCRQSTVSKMCQLTCSSCRDKATVKISNESTKKQKRLPHSKKCVDKMVGCFVFAQNGRCKRRGDRINKKCRKTCGLCAAKAVSGHTRPRNNLFAFSTKGCVDTSKTCKLLRSRGWCKHRKQHMKSKCRKSCHFCSSCHDERSDCGELKRIGFCEKRPAQMYKMCKKTCALCTSVETNEIVHVVPTQPSRGCVDTFGQKRCEYYAHIGMCTKDPKFKKVCHNTCVCNFKTPPDRRHCKSSKHGCCWDNKTTKKDVYGSDCPVCKDDPRFEVLCARFGEDCEGSGGLGHSVRKHCPKTCNFCS